MKRPIRILLQTTIPESEDDWHIGHLSLLGDHLASLKDEAGNGLCQVTARNRDSHVGAGDPVLRTLDRSDYEVRLLSEHSRAQSEVRYFFHDIR